MPGSSGSGPELQQTQNGGGLLCKTLWPPLGQHRRTRSEGSCQVRLGPGAMPSGAAGAASHSPPFSKGLLRWSRRISCGPRAELKCTQGHYCEGAPRQNNYQFYLKWLGEHTGTQSWKEGLSLHKNGSLALHQSPLSMEELHAVLAVRAWGQPGVSFRLRRDHLTQLGDLMKRRGPIS